MGKECGTRQLAWLQNDLANNTKGCTIAYLHKPRFSIGDHGDDSSMQPFWSLLNQYGAEVLLAGHDHNYERQVPRNAAGAADPTNGVRQFVVGTGGKGLRGIHSNAFIAGKQQRHLRVPGDDVACELLRLAIRPCELTGQWHVHGFRIDGLPSLVDEPPVVAGR